MYYPFALLFCIYTNTNLQPEGEWLLFSSCKYNFSTLTLDYLCKATTPHSLWLKRHDVITMSVRDVIGLARTALLLADERRHSWTPRHLAEVSRSSSERNSLLIGTANKPKTHFHLLTSSFRGTHYRVSMSRVDTEASIIYVKLLIMFLKLLIRHLYFWFLLYSNQDCII